MASTAGLVINTMAITCLVVAAVMLVVTWPVQSVTAPALQMWCLAFSFAVLVQYVIAGALCARTAAGLRLTNLSGCSRCCLSMVGADMVLGLYLLVMEIYQGPLCLPVYSHWIQVAGLIAACVRTSLTCTEMFADLYRLTEPARAVFVDRGVPGDHWRSAPGGVSLDVLISLRQGPEHNSSRLPGPTTDTPPTCSICWSPVGTSTVERPTTKLPKCHHLFHSDCAETWLKTKNSCPLCRSPVVPADAAGGP
jgi:hypothetical protein